MPITVILQTVIINIRPIKICLRLLPVQRNGFAKPFQRLLKPHEGYYYNRALLFLNIGDVERALADYDAALHVNPDYALAL